MNASVQPHAAPEPAQTSTQGPIGEPRVGVLSGDRLCTRCAFNLSGQTIVREKHYGLMIVRCPECGTPAALQEYPLLARSAARLGHLAGALYLLGMLGLALLTALVIWGMSNSLSESLGAPYQRYVGDLWNKHQEEQRTKNPNATTYNWSADMQWWDSLDKAQLFKDAGGWDKAVSWPSLWAGLFVGLAVVPFGVALAVAAPHLRWRGRIALALLAGALGAAFWVMDLTFTSRFAYVYAYGGYGAWRQLGHVLMPISLGIALAWLLVGLGVGRPIARAAARLLLPPRLRGPLAFLWFVDGKAYTPR